MVHAASDTHRLGRADVEQTRNLIRALDKGTHLVYVSIVGIDKIGFAYYRRKLACEYEVETSGIPHTIVRATQFHELIAMMLAAAQHLPVAPLPLDFCFQSVAAADVGGRLAEVVSSPPAGRADDFGGPEVLTLGDMGRVWKAAFGRPRSLVRLPVPGAVADGFRRGDNTCPDHPDGKQSWEEFVHERVRRTAA